MITIFCYLGIVILNSDDPSVTGGSVVLHGLDVQRLDGEGVHHSDVDPGLLEGVGGLEGLVQGHPGADHQHLVRVRLAENLGFADGELLIIGVYDRGGGAAHTKEADLEPENKIQTRHLRDIYPSGVGSKLGGVLTRHGV